MPDPWAWGSLPEQRVTLWIVKRERNRVSHCTLQAEGGDSPLLPSFSESQDLNGSFWLSKIFLVWLNSGPL